MSVKVDVKDLLAAGAHFGHKTSRWHPKMAPYIYGKRNGAHVIDLTKTEAALNAALPRITEIVKNGGKVLFVGTRKSLQDATKAAAESVNMPYVTERWVGGTLTNTTTIAKQLRKLADLERRMASGELDNRYSKLEVQRFQEEIDALELRYGGIKNLSGKPAALIVADAKERADGIVRQAELEAQLERRKAADEMKHELVDLSTQLAEKMLQREIRQQDHHDIIQAFVDQIGENDDRDQ